MVVRVLQHNCQRPVDAMTTLMAKVADMAEVVLIQEPAVRWVADVRGGNLGQQDTGGEQNGGSGACGRNDGGHSSSREGVSGVGGRGLRRVMDNGKEREVV
jgi:hypothetical protein